MEELILAQAVNNGGEIHLNISGPSLDESFASMLGEHVLLENGSFIDNDNTSIILKVIDQGGNFYLDPSQFANFTIEESDGGGCNQSNNLTLEMLQFQQNSTQSQFSKGQATTASLCGTQTVSAKPISSVHQIQDMTPKAQSPRKKPTTTKPSGPWPPNINLSVKPNAAPIVKSLNVSPSKTNSQKSPSSAQTVKRGIANLMPAAIDEPFRCNICQKEFLKLGSFRKHNLEHLDEKPFHCEICPAGFNFEINLKLHGMLHEAERTGCLECQICATKLSRLASLKTHVRVHEKEENLLCIECGDEFPTKGRLEAHLEEHRTRTQQCMLHRCRLCGKSFTQAALLKDHAKEQCTAVRRELKLMHTRKRKVKSAPSTSSGNSGLPRANFRNEGKRSRTCHICGKYFEKPSQLQRHIRVHTGEKPFGCNHCGRTFNQKGTLDSHIQATHDKMKPFVCQLCSCKFSQRGNLKAHVLKVHVPPGENEEAFKCLECSCVYRRLATLNNHIAKVHAVHSYPRGLISVSKNAPKLVPEPNNPNVLVTVHASQTTHTATPSFDLAKVIEPAQRRKEQNPGPSRLEPSKVAVNKPKKKELPSKLPKEERVEKESPAEPNDQVGSESVAGSISEVNLIHNEQGKAGSCLVKVKKVGEQKWHLCHSCSKAFRKPSDLIRHLRVHTQEKPYTCYICYKAFAVNSTLKQHLRTHTVNKELECQTCNRKFGMLSSLKAHERLHTGMRPFSCLQCGKGFRTSGQRRIHSRIHFTNPNGFTGKRKLLRIGENQPDVNVELPNPLKITAEGLVPVLNRSVHTLGEAGVQDGKPRKYKCKMCPKSFKKSSHLKQHIRSHTGERPYQCFQCQRSFVSSGVLKTHIRTHEGVREYQCPTCKLFFTTNGSLTRHMATHSTVRNFMCPYCEKKFKTSVACRKHIKTHRAEIIALSNAGISPTQIYQKRGTVHTNNYTQMLEEPVANQNVVPLNAQNVNEFHQGLSASHFDDDFLSGLGLDDIQTTSGMITDINASLSASTTETSANQHSLINSSNPSISLGNNNIHVQQVEDANGYITLQYSMGSPTQQINDNIFNQTNYPHLSVDSLGHQHTPHFELTQQLETPSDSVNQMEPPTSSSHIQTYEYYNYPSVGPNEAPQSTESKTILPKSVPPIDYDDPDYAAKAAQVEQIHESSRTISVQIYNELKTQKEKANVLRPPEPSTTTTSKFNQCQYCDRGFKKRSDLQRHLRIHTGEKPFRCHICSKAFRVKSTREVHMRVHTGGKSVSCHICSNLFATKSSLRVHMRLHTNSKPYKCIHPNCDRWFRTSGHRKAHIQSHFKAPRKPKPVPTSSRRASGNNNLDRVQFPTATDPPTATSVSLQNINNNQSSSVSQAGLNVSSSSHQVLPSVNVLQRNTSTGIASQLEIDNITPTLASTSTDQSARVFNDVSDPNSTPLHAVNNIQVAIDGQTIQITGLDLNSLQLDDNFLQSLTIYIPPLNSVSTSSSDLSGNNNANNILLSMLPSTSISNVDDITSIELTKEQLNNLFAANQSQHSTPTFNLLNDLNLSILPSASTTNNNPNELNLVNSVSQYVINNNAMMSSTAMSSMARQNIQNTNESKSRLNSNMDNRTCEHCHKVFAKPSLLARHSRVHTGERPFRCKICRKAFSQKSSLISHSYVHTNEKPFCCPSCTFRTVQRAALKKHFVRAHPSERWPEDLQRQDSTSTLQLNPSNPKEILGV